MCAVYLLEPFGLCILADGISITLLLTFIYFPPDNSFFFFFWQKMNLIKILKMKQCFFTNFFVKAGEGLFSPKQSCPDEYITPGWMGRGSFFIGCGMYKAVGIMHLFKLHAMTAHFTDSLTH